MNWRSISALVAALGGLAAIVVAAVMKVAAGGDAAVLDWAERNPDALAWIALGASLIAVIGAYSIMRSRSKEEYRAHSRLHGH